MANKAFEFRIKPTEEQKILINKTFGCVRFIYNKMLGEKDSHYKETGEMLNTTPAQYKEEFPWLREVDSLALANGQLNLETAFKRFFEDEKVGYPNYKAKHFSKRSYTTNLVNNNIVILDKHIKLPKLGLVKMIKHREIPENYKLKSVTVKQNRAGEYYVSILFFFEQNVEKVEPVNVEGLDYSMKELYITSKGETPGKIDYYRQDEDKLAREQRKLSRMEVGSNNYNEQQKKIAKINLRIANRRKDARHKESCKIADCYDAVCIEDLNMKAMSQCLKFGKTVHDNGWGMFVNQLSYKLEERGKQLVKIDKWFPSSKTCSVCGKKKDDLKLGERTYICECGNILDRDINAAINIKNEGKRILGLTEGSNDNRQPQDLRG